MAIDKLERQLNLVAALLNAEHPLTAAEIRTKIEGYPTDSLTAFRRAFERDKDDLRTLGLPVETIDLPNTNPLEQGYRIPPEQYYMPAIDLSPDELAALHFATLAVQVGDPDVEALWKLGGLGMTGAELDGVEALARLDSDANVVALFEAVTKRQAVTFSYNEASREVEPWRLDYQRGRWYLIGFDRSRQARRTFRLDRFEGNIESVGAEGVVVIGEETDGQRQMRPWQLHLEDRLDIELLVDPPLVHAARVRLGAEVAETEQANGGSVFTVPVTHFAGFRSVVLEFLDGAEIIAPPQARQAMREWLEHMAAAPDA